MNVSVITPTRNRAHILQYCIERLLDQTRQPDEIIVVDDASNDGTEGLSILKKTKYIKFEERIGHWRARNIAVREAAGDLIIFVDSDVLVARNFIEDHLFLHEKDAKIVVQGLVRHIRSPRSFGNFTLRVDGLCLTGLVIQNCSLRKKWILDAGLFDDYKLMGYMDVEFGMRLKKMGIRRVVSVRRCIAYHVDGYPTREWLNNLLSKFEERGRTSWRFIQRAKSWTGEGISNRRVVLLSNMLSTPRWAEKGRLVDLLLKSVDSPFIFVFPLLKEVLKLHYRAKGIREG
ncbi:hypothetical protein CH333_01915 [candidate division WOR-3 bacterium JGI_Cruoil_03_44_89]|uniref:Glycosyltransferase 2-like domain-containing protein n=1 Tax=candidate division WOR-3 bacterium JGI_Cruoil_03_44_89 TaxID=1973748 RepID=A0A235BXP3_UNCW3|nr:MAG: hypothetical protein CH333_01915 [candidate division WOR-3 bacterium JGI_Cruoil_03_44_89]